MAISNVAYFLLLCLPILYVLVTQGVDGHLTQCNMGSPSCEIFLEIEHWMTMRKEYGQKVYINSTDGKIYQYNDDTNTEIDPHDIVLADGSDHDKVIAVFNRTMPGPTLVVYKNQEVTIHVKNLMLSDGVSVHFHGMEMRGTPWMDGASFVTQCPIMPGQSFTYRFRPSRSGTYFYHSHLGMQRNMGLVAPFIVKEPSSDSMGQMREYIIVIQDYHNSKTGDNFEMDIRLGHFLSDGTMLPFRQNVKLTSTLINGRGRAYNSNGTVTTHTPFPVFKVTSGNKFKFRVIVASFILQYKLSIDYHEFKVVAMDGNDIEPVTTDYVILHSGERADLILEANQTSGNYWIRVETLRQSRGPPAFAILRYEDGNEVEPTSEPRNCSEINPCVAVNCPFLSTATLTCINMEDLNNMNHSDTVPVPESADTFKEFFLNFGVAYNEQGHLVAHVNGTNLKLPTVSALTQPQEVSGFCDDHNNCGPEKVCSCNAPLNVNFGDTVQINILNVGNLARSSHSIHIHGYSFHIVKVGYGEPRIDNSDIDCHTDDQGSSLCNNNPAWRNTSWADGNIPDLKISKAVRKDTVTVPGKGYVIVRFKADNPGLWFIHCHLEIHSTIRGMGILLNDSFSHVPPPPYGFPECRSFSANMAPTRETTEAPTTAVVTTTDDVTNNEEILTEKRTFSEGEFWGMVGTLSFIILVQLCVTVACYRKKISKSLY
ncbi:hypothetical protein ACF0H5_012113 [Mactra antiquata]